MNPTGKKLISLFLVFSIMMLSVNLYAKERRGVKLVITTLDEQQIEGELIAVKPNSLLLLNAQGKDVPVDIEEIKVIRIVKKPKVLRGAEWGGLIGTGVGIFLSELGGLSWDWPYAAFAYIGVLLGGLFGLAAGKDKTIQIEGMTGSEIQETLDNLRKIARIRDYK